MIGPKVLDVPTAPVTPTEVDRVGSCLADNQARLLYQDGDPIGLPGERTWREYASWWWVNQRTQQRVRWLRIEGYGGPGREVEESKLAMTSFGRLPPYLQSRLMHQNPPTDLELNIGQPVASGTAAERAARMFDAEPRTPATDAEQGAERVIFARGGGAIPVRDMPDLAPVVNALRELQQNNQGGRQKVLGLAYTNRWWNDPRKLQQATEMRSAGVKARDIAAKLGISVGSMYYGLKTSGASSETLLNRRILDAQQGSGKRHNSSRAARTRRPRTGERQTEGRREGRD
ncbi:hypothetical protein GCM10027613_51340 [Microlunatus endophyticus]